MHILVVLASGRARRTRLLPHMTRASSPAGLNCSGEIMLKPLLALQSACVTVQRKGPRLLLMRDRVLASPLPAAPALSRCSRSSPGQAYATHGSTHGIHGASVAAVDTAVSQLAGIKRVGKEEHVCRLPCFLLGSCLSSPRRLA